MSTLPPTTANLLALRAQGLNLREIAARTGLSLSTVSRRLNLKVDKPRKVKVPEGMQRKCLCCGDTFWSQGAYNRLCKRCRASSVSPFDSPHSVTY
jgi:predicted DNA-binding transcriptional regulator AlpA